MYLLDIFLDNFYKGTTKANPLRQDVRVSSIIDGTENDEEVAFDDDGEGEFDIHLDSDEEEGGKPPLNNKREAALHPIDPLKGGLNSYVRVVHIC